MNKQETPKDTTSEESQVSVPDAARALGLDSFTLLSLIQRDRVSVTRSRSGEIMIPESDLARLTVRQRGAVW